MKILTHPDPLLRVRSAEVEDFGTDFQKLVTDMTWTLMAIPTGIGLAAIQVGVPLKVMIYRTDKGILSTLVNPKIIETKGPQYMGYEGCLSLPGVLHKLARYERIRVTFFDRTGNNEETQWFIGEAATVIQHEIDHMFGVLITD